MKYLFLKVEPMLYIDNSDYLIAFIVGVVLFIIGVLITRAIFAIPTIVRQQIAHTKLLGKIAEIQGVNKDEVQSILFEAELISSENNGNENGKVFSINANNLYEVVNNHTIKVIKPFYVDEKKFENNNEYDISGFNGFDFIKNANSLINVRQIGNIYIINLDYKNSKKSISNFK